MGFRKIQKVENAEVLTPEEHQRLEEELHRTSKVSMTEADDTDRRRIARALED